MSQPRYALVQLPVSDLSLSAAFYRSALAPLGFSIAAATDRTVRFATVGAETFAIEQRGRPSVGSRITFHAESESAVDAFYAAALAAGREAPASGRRADSAGLYSAFVFDPDGHRIEAAHPAGA